MKASIPLLSLVQKYFENDPAAAAHALETMSPEEAVEVLKNIPLAMATKALGHLNDSYAAVLLQQMPRSLFPRIVNGLDAQQAASMFMQLNSELRQELLQHLEEKRKRQIQEYLSFPEDSAGRIMTLDVIAFHGDIKVKEAIQKIRLLAQRGSSSSYVYVVDKENKLVGVMNMRDMLIAAESDLLENVMRRDIYSVNCFMDRETVANEFKSRRFFVAPVVDNQQRLLGIVRAERLIGDVQEEASEDMQKMFGASGDENVFSPLSFSLRTRLPWLHVNLFTAFLAAGVVAMFEEIIGKLTVLAVFLPVIAGQGGNAGAQSLAVVMRGLVMREIPPQKVKQLILKETLVGTINGIIIGLVTGAVAWLWNGNPYFGLVVCLGMLVNLAIAGCAGAAIPIAMKAIGMDPAQCSNIILTTVTDVMGFFAFLGFAVLFQNYLL
jgi:magnesium transporter